MIILITNITLLQVFCGLGFKISIEYNSAQPNFMRRPYQGQKCGERYLPEGYQDEEHASKNPSLGDQGYIRIVWAIH